MTKEQEEAIEMLEDIKNNTWTTKYIMSSDSKKAETVLNMLKEKDIMIDLLIDKLNLNYTAVFKNNEVKEIIEIYEKIKNTSNLSGIKLRKECIKQYFERKSEV